MTREEAINKLRQMTLPEETMEILEALAPELKESEDEKIRKHIIEILEHLSPCHWDGNEKSECIAYLEKPAEPQPHWEPSEKQINMLGVIVEREKEKKLYGIDGYSPAAVLESLYNDLKKLI